MAKWPNHAPQRGSIKGDEFYSQNVQPFSRLTGEIRKPGIEEAGNGNGINRHSRISVLTIGERFLAGAVEAPSVKK